MKILLTTDGSEWSEGSAKYLARFPFTQNDEIVVLHVVPVSSFTGALEPHYSPLRQIGKEIAPRILDLTTRHLKHVKAKVAPAVMEGHQDEVIIRAAKDSNANLIVMGARGMKGIGAFFLGSVTRSVAINSPYPVLVVRPPQWKHEGAVKVLFATDGSLSAMEAARLLTAIPFPEDTEVTVLYVLYSAQMQIPDLLYPELDERIKSIVAGMTEVEYKHAEKVLERARAVLQERFPKLSVLTRSGDPSQEILNAAQSMGTVTIAVGSKGTRGVRGMLGSVARNILGHADCSVLIGRKTSEAKEH